MIFVDTGYFVAVLDRRDQLHARAMAWAARVRGGLVTTSAVLLETFNNLSATHLRMVPHRLVDGLTTAGSLSVVNVDPALWSRGLQFHRGRPDKTWSLTDCISFLVMREGQMTRALAYDHHFEQAGFEALLRRDPP